MYKDNELTIRPIEEKDLFNIWEFVYKEGSKYRNRKGKFNRM